MPGSDSTVRIHPRRAAHPDDPAAGAVWEGDWITTFSWLRSTALANLTTDRLLDLAFRDVLPEHVILGVADAAPGARWHPSRPACSPAGSTLPAAITWRRAIGAGALTITTFRLGADRGPMAAALLAEHIDLTGRTANDRGEEPR